MLIDEQLQFSTGPESKGIETMEDVKPGLSGAFSTGPESKGIETSTTTFDPRPEGRFSTGPESKGIETVRHVAKPNWYYVQHWP